MVNAENNFVIVEKRKYDNEDYEWDALELALDYAIQFSDTGEDIELVGDNNQVIRWIQENKPITGNSIIKQKCLEKLNYLRTDNRVIGVWVKRNENLAGRVLEYRTRKFDKPIKFTAVWFKCARCVFKSLNEKELKEHFYNSHVVNAS